MINIYIEHGKHQEDWKYGKYKKYGVDTFWNIITTQFVIAF
jgi:hypothetical protein